MMANYSQNMWIGLREARGFQWTEGKRVTYSNFVNGRMAMYAASIRVNFIFNWLINTTFCTGQYIVKR